MMQVGYRDFLEIFKPMREVEANLILSDEEKKIFCDILNNFFSEAHLGLAMIERLFKTSIVYIDSCPHENNRFSLDYSLNLHVIYISSVSVYPISKLHWNVFFKSFLLHELVHKIQFFNLGHDYMSKCLNEYDYFQSPLEKQAYFCQYSYIKEDKNERSNYRRHCL